METPKSETPAASEDKAIFTKAELERMLESIGHWWHRHGYEEQEEVEAYICRLYEFVPAELREGLDADLVQVSLGDLYRLLGDTLGPIFGQAELTEELKRFRKDLLEGGHEENGVLTVKRGLFLSKFDEFFDPEDMSQDLAEQVEQIKGYLLS